MGNYKIFAQVTCVFFFRGALHTKRAKTELKSEIVSYFKFTKLPLKNIAKSDLKKAI